MLKKEWNELIVQSLIITGILCLFPGLLILLRLLPGLTYAEVFFPCFQFGLFSWAFFLGASFLSSDRLQRGVVYLLSLPYSRLKLLSFKALPRLSVLLLFYGVYMVIVSLWGADLTAISFISFSLIYFLLFVIALSVSVCSENFLVLFFTTLFGLVAFWGLQLVFILAGLRLKGYTSYEFNIRMFFNGELDDFLARLIIGATVLLLVPVLISFVWAFTRFDARPLSVFNKRYLVRLAGIFVLGTAAALLFAYQTTDIGDTSYYLTHDHKVIRVRNYSRVKISSQDSEHTLSGPFFYPYSYLEIGDAVFYKTFQGIDRLSLKDFSRENIYALPPGRNFRYSFGFYAETLVIMTRKKDYSDPRLELLDLQTRTLKSISLEDDSLSELRLPRILGTDSVQGERFWLLAGIYSRPLWHVFRIWESGRIEKVIETRKTPSYVNHMLLIYTDTEILFSRDLGNGFENEHTLPNPESYIFNLDYRYRTDLGKEPATEIYGQGRSRESLQQRNSARYARLDLVDFRLEPLEELALYPHFVGPDEYYCLEVPELGSGPSDVRLHRLEKGRLSSSVVIYPDMDFKDYEENVYFQFFAGGFVAQRKGRVSIYAFPDLTELKFKGLN